MSSLIFPLVQLFSTYNSGMYNLVPLGMMLLSSVFDWASQLKVQKPRTDSKGILMACAFLLLINVWFSLHQISKEGLEWKLTSSLVLFCGFYGLTLHHELVHNKPSSWSFIIGTWVSSFIFFTPHYRIYHNLAHHKSVGTPADYETCLRGSSIYSFIFSGSSFLKPYVYHAIEYLAKYPWKILDYFPLVLHIVLVYMILGHAALIATFIVFVGVAVVLSLGTYIHVSQHYGMKRDPKQVHVIQYHTWSDSGLLLNYLFFDIGLHFLHHNSSMPNSNMYKSVETPLPTILLLLTVFYPNFYFSLVHPELDNLKHNKK